MLGIEEEDLSMQTSPAFCLSVTVCSSYSRASKMIQQVKVLAVMPDDLSLIPVAEGENQHR